MMWVDWFGRGCRKNKEAKASKKAAAKKNK
jgi:hypothetical protein